MLVTSSRCKTARVRTQNLSPSGKASCGLSGLTFCVKKPKHGQHSKNNQPVIRARRERERTYGSRTVISARPWQSLFQPQVLSDVFSLREVTGNLWQAVFEGLSLIAGVRRQLKGQVAILLSCRQWGSNWKRGLLCPVDNSTDGSRGKRAGDNRKRFLRN